jgi:hypothetical protein
MMTTQRVLRHELALSSPEQARFQFIDVAAAEHSGVRFTGAINWATTFTTNGFS